MDFQSAMETFAEAWVVANSKSGAAGLEPPPLQNEALSLTCVKRSSSPVCDRGPKISNTDPAAMYGKDSSKNAIDKSLPVHCIIETIFSLDESERENWRRKSQIETDSYVIIPVNTPIQELLVVALTRLGYPKETASVAKGAILLRNWRPLAFETISPSPLATVGELLGELSTVATLRIQILRPRGSSVQEMKDKLLKLLISQNHSLLMRSGCPLDTLTLLNLCRDTGSLHALAEPSEDLSNKFEAWVASQLNTPIHPMVSPVLPHRLVPSPRKEDVPMALHSQMVQKTRMRTSFDPELELPKLQKWFHENQHPSRQQIQQYVKELNNLECRRGRKPLDINNVVYWFKNARAAQKRAELRGFCAPLAPLLNGFQNFHNTLRSQPSSVTPSEQPSVSDDDISRTSDLDESNNQIEVNDSDAEMPLALTKAEQNLEEAGKQMEENPRTPKAKSESPLEDEQNNNVAKDSDAHEETSISDDDETQDDERSLDLRKESVESGRSPSPSLSQRMVHGFPLVSNSMFSHSIMYMSHYMPGLSPMAPQTREQALMLSQDERRKRNRTFIDPVTEVPRLEQWFSLNTHPSHNLILKYTDELNRMPYRQKFPRLEPKNVQFWFKNRRAKCKRLKMSLFDNQGTHYSGN